MKKTIFFAVCAFITNITSANISTSLPSKKNDPRFLNLASEKINIQEIQDESATPYTECGAQTFYGNCCGNTVTCGWFFICIHNGNITYAEFFSMCSDPNLCQGIECESEIEP